MVNKPRFTKNPKLEMELERANFLEKEMHKKASAAAAIAKSIAPVATGDYRDGIGADSGKEGGKVRAHLFGKDFKSGWIEFGTMKTPAYAVLRRAIEAVGLRLTREKG